MVAFWLGIALATVLIAFLISLGRVRRLTEDKTALERKVKEAKTARADAEAHAARLVSMIRASQLRQVAASVQGEADKCANANRFVVLADYLCNEVAKELDARRPPNLQINLAQEIKLPDALASGRNVAKDKTEQAKAPLEGVDGDFVDALQRLRAKMNERIAEVRNRHPGAPLQIDRLRRDLHSFADDLEDAARRYLQATDGG
jgi:hypothetical protein